VRQQAESRGITHVHAEVQDLTALSLPNDSMDGAFARWVMCFLPNPADVIARVARALKPGAAFVIFDYLHYEGFRMSPPSAITQRIFSAVADSFRAHGGNPSIGLELPAMMRDAGLQVRDIRPVVRIGRPGSALWDWPRTFFENYLPTLVESGALSEAEKDEFWKDYTERSANPAAYFMSPPIVEMVGIKAG
jgi:SAM-dependent methyltransferase